MSLHFVPREGVAVQRTAPGSTEQNRSQCDPEEVNFCMKKLSFALYQNHCADSFGNGLSRPRVLGPRCSKAARAILGRRVENSRPKYRL